MGPQNTILIIKAPVLRFLGFGGVGFRVQSIGFRVGVWGSGV